MTSKKDWLPRRRDEILGMAMKWNNVLAMKGQTVYFCIRYENSKGKAGPWGPIFQAIIP